MLNALRHQRFWQSERPSAGTASPRCAQRLAASEVLAGRSASRGTTPSNVLNALRHQRFWQSERPSAGTASPRCAQRLAASEVLADRSDAVRAAGGTRAQRLAASEVLADENFAGHTLTAPSAQRLAASEVLAGFRVPCPVEQALCSTPCGIRGFGRSRRRRFCGRPCRAQRLAASEVLAAPGARRNSAGTTVLNALRHQRFWQSLSRENFECSDMCSTPCGIRGFGSWAYPPCIPPHPVLNALRHQRFWQHVGRRL